MTEETEVKTTVTQEDVDGAIKSIHYDKLGLKTTLCFLTLMNGFEIATTSGCVKAENYDEAMGQEIALKRAKDKIWELLGFNLQCNLGNEIK